MNVFNRTFLFNGIEVTRLWHCFGNFMHKVDLLLVLEMLTVSKTNVLPVNTHALTKDNQAEGLIIGFGGVRLNSLARVHDLKKMFIMLNINHQISEEAAVEKTLLAVELTGERLIKLEILNRDLKTSNNKELLSTVKRLNRLKDNLVILPLLDSCVEDAKKLIDLGCPLLRVMGSDIGSGQGIINPKKFEKICQLGVPVILDGGVANATDFMKAAELGAKGCLINSMLFNSDLTPVESLKRFMLESSVVFEYLEASESKVVL